MWETGSHPWLVDEKRAIREWAINRNRPFLSGICLGLQLLAEALGGKIGVASKPEVGIGEVKLSSLGRQHRIKQWFEANFEGDAIGTMPKCRNCRWVPKCLPRLQQRKFKSWQWPILCLPPSFMRN